MRNEIQRRWFAFRMIMISRGLCVALIVGPRVCWNKNITWLGIRTLRWVANIGFHAQLIELAHWPKKIHSGLFPYKKTKVILLKLQFLYWNIWAWLRSKTLRCGTRCARFAFRLSMISIGLIILHFLLEYKKYITRPWLLSGRDSYNQMRPERDVSVRGVAVIQPLKCVPRKS